MTSHVESPRSYQYRALSTSRQYFCKDIRIVDIVEYQKPPTAVIYMRVTLSLSTDTSASSKRNKIAQDDQLGCGKKLTDTL
jgi:hypothetical protein